ncbi:MAG: CoA-binding protein [Anaerolineae bacterium]
MLITYDTAAIRALLTETRVIAVVGHSDQRYRTSYQVARYLRRAGYKIYPVNPEVETIDGEICYPSLAAVPEPIDLVNVFRRSEYLAGVVDEAIAVGAKAVWAQLGVESDEAAGKAEKAGIPLVMDRCIKVDHSRLL